MKWINTLICLLCLLMPWVSIQAKDLALPQQLPKLTTTQTEKLGTRQDKIGLAPGAKVSNFKVEDHIGNSISMAQLSELAPLLVVFYRGGWCPFCNLQIRQLTEAWPQFKQRNVMPVVISVDKPDAAALAQRQYDIPFPVLSDPDLLAHNAFEVTMKIDDEHIPKYKEYGIDVEQWSGRDHHTIAVSSAFIVAKSGEVLWSHSSLDYKTRPSVKQLLKVIDGL